MKPFNLKSNSTRTSL